MAEVAEVIKVIGINIEHNAKLRLEGQKSLHVFAGLGDEVVAMADAHIAP